MVKLEDPSTTVPSSKAEEIESSSEEDYDQKTIFSSDDEDEPNDSPPRFYLVKVSPPVLVSEKNNEEVCDSGEAPTVKSGTKRPSEETLTDVNTKRLKKRDEKKNIEVGGRRSKLWSEEDEIAILQGMIDFKTDQWKKEGFYETVKNAISFNVGTRQFMDKIRSLKKKYLGQVKKNGFEQSFLRVHDQKCFELSKATWGPDGIAYVKSSEESKKMVIDSDVKSNGEPKTKKPESLKEDDVGVESSKSDWFEKSFLIRGIRSIGVDEHLVKQRWSKVQVEAKKRIEDKLKLLQEKEFECAAQKANLLHEVASAIA